MTLLRITADISFALFISVASMALCYSFSLVESTTLFVGVLAGLLGWFLFDMFVELRAELFRPASFSIGRVLCFFPIGYAVVYLATLVFSSWVLGFNARGVEGALIVALYLPILSIPATLVAACMLAPRRGAI